jgi:hypothetical protein
VSRALAFAAGTALLVWGETGQLVARQLAQVSRTAEAGRVNISYADARPVLEALRADLLPSDLRGLPPAQLGAVWDAWVARRDADIRARVADGDLDSVVTLLLFGVTFTTEPRYSFTTLLRERARQTTVDDVVTADPVVQRRIRDLATGILTPGTNERLQFARRVVERTGLDPRAAANGRQAVERLLREALTRVLVDYDSYFRDNSVGATQFRSRGLSSDTSVYAAFAVDRSLRDLQTQRVLAPRSISRVAVVGPGLDFVDKQEGYDFYPVQTIQPFAVIDSLRALGLAGANGVSLTTFDLSARVNEHLEKARREARAGRSYVVQLPREASQRWQADLVSYWQGFGGRIGMPTAPAAPPPGLSGVTLRAVRIRPDVVASITPRDLNIVLQRPAPLPDGERFDLVIATNILIYYDIFEQSLALVNVSKLLRPGGILLTNNPLFELPTVPMRTGGETEVRYVPGGSDGVVWYRRE